MKERLKLAPSTRTRSQGKKKVEEEVLESPEESSKEEEAGNSSSKNSKKIESNEDKQMRKIKEELKNKLAISK